MNPSTPATARSSHYSRIGLLIWLWVAILCCSAYTTDVHAADAANRQQAIDMALEQNGGRGKVLGVTTQTREDGQIVFAVKVLADDGRVRVFRINKAR